MQNEITLTAQIETLATPLAQNQKEMLELMANFGHNLAAGYTRKEPKDLWVKGYYYTHGETNVGFKMFLQGVAFMKSQLCMALASAEQD